MQINYNSLDYTSASVKVTVQSGSAARTEDKDSGAAKSAGKQDAFVPSRDAAARLSTVEQMKADLQAQQAKLFDQVRGILEKQGMQVTLGDGAWRIFSEGNFKVDPETQAAAKQAISEDGYWGVKQTSQRIVDFAKALVGGDPSKVEMMRDAFVKGFESAKKAWGGELPDITKGTYDAVMKLFDEWAGEDGAESGAPAETGASAGTSVTLEYEYTRVTSKSVSVTANAEDAAWLENAGVLSGVSDPIQLNGMTLNASWCMNEKVSVTVTVGGASAEGGRVPAPGQDGFVSRREEDFGGYDRRGRQSGSRGPRPERSGREMQLDFFKPLELEGGKSGTVRVAGQDVPLHEDGTVTVGLPDGTLRRAKVDQKALDRAVRREQRAAEKTEKKD